MADPVSSATKAVEARRHRRHQIGRHLKGRLVDTNAPILVANISQGGFAMITQAPVPAGTVSGFRFTARDGSAFLVRGCVTHTRAVRFGPTSSEGFLSGVKFAAENTVMGHHAVEMLLGEVRRLLTAPPPTPVPAPAAPAKPAPAMSKEAQRYTPTQAAPRIRVNRW